MHINPLNHISWPTSSQTAFVAIEAGHSHNQSFGPTIKIVPLDSEEAADRLRTIPAPAPLPGYDFDIPDEDLERIFSSAWQDWLRPALEAQLRHWRKHHVEKYFQYTPYPVDADELWCCVKGAAFQALTRFRHRLNPTQVRVALARSRKGAVLFGPNRFYDPDREKDLARFAEDALRYGSDGLTDDELIRCAALKPQVVFRHCGKMKGKPFIIALVAALKALRGGSLGDDLKRRVSTRQLIDSLLEHPGEWHSRVPGGLPEVFNLWRDQLGADLSPAELDEIHQRLDPEYSSFTKSP